MKIRILRATGGVVSSAPGVNRAFPTVAQALRPLSRDGVRVILDRKNSADCKSLPGTLTSLDGKHASIDGAFWTLALCGYCLRPAQVQERSCGQ